MLVVETLTPLRCQAKGEQPKTIQGLSPESQGQNLALTVLHVPYSLDSGRTTMVIDQAPDKPLLNAAALNLQPHGWTLRVLRRKIAVTLT